MNIRVSLREGFLKQGRRLRIYWISKAGYMGEIDQTHVIVVLLVNTFNQYLALCIVIIHSPLGKRKPIVIIN